MTADVYKRIVLQLLQYVLSLQCNSKPSGEEPSNDVEVRFTTCDGKLPKIEVDFQSTKLPSFDIRSFSKVIVEDMYAIMEYSKLESQDNYPGLSILQSIDGISALFTLRCANNINKDSLSKLNRSVPQKSLVVESIQESNITFSRSRYESFLLITLELSVSQNEILNLENSTLNFMKKCQLVNPYLTVTCSSINNIKRFGLNGNGSSEASLLQNIGSYLRNVDTATNINPVRSLVQHIKRDSFDNDLCFSLIYTCASDTKIGRQNHYHVFLFSKQGVPINMETTKWHAGVHFTDTEMDISLEPSLDCDEMTDICYKLKNVVVSSCYLVFIIVQNTYDMEVILKEHGKLMTGALIQILKTMLSNLEEQEHDKKLNHMAAKSVGSVIRFTENGKLRCECLELLQARDTMDAEGEINSRLQKHSLPS